MRALHGPAAPRRQRTVWLWLACVVAAVWITLRADYVADLSAFLPSAPSAEQAVLLEQIRSGAAARLVLVGIEGGDAQARAEASRQLAQALRRSGDFDAVHNGDAADFRAAGQFLFEHRYLLSPAIDAERFSVAGLRAAIDDTVALLGTPAGALVRPLILRDPTGETARMAEAMLPAHAPRSVDGVWASRSAPRAVIVATTRAAGSDLDGQERALAAVRSGFAPQAAHGLRLELSGPGRFGVAARAQIRHEVERLALAGSVLVIALLLAAFGSLRALATAVLPVATGVLAGIAAVSLGFGKVHGITLGFGTTLIGEAVDYAIYYLIQARPQRAAGSPSGAQRWIAGSWPTVRLGLWTSLCGFAALACSGFPGLAQLGVFSFVGLAAAAFSTRYVFPVLAPDGAPGQGLRRRLGRLAARAAATLPRAGWPLRLLVGAAIVALALLPSAWRGDLNSLSPVGAAALRLDAELRADVGAAEGGTLVAVSAPDEAGALAAAEAAGRRLDRLVDDGVLLGYASPARWLPSPATQAARRAALPDAATLKARLAAATADGPLNAGRLNGFIDDVEKARHAPDLGDADLAGTPLASAVDALLVRGHGGQPWRALLSLQSATPTLDGARLRAALAGLPDTQVVEIGRELGALYARYLHQAMLQALLGGGAVCLLLALHLRQWRRLLQVLEPIAAAVLLVLAAFSAAGIALGILHLVGFLLVAAIGSNYALFFDHLRRQRSVDADTLASLALANLTTVLSFGLLAFSKIPALYAIGQVVAPGALLSLLLAAALIRPPAAAAA